MSGPVAPVDAAHASRQVLGRGSIYTLASAAPILAQVAVTPVVTRVLGQQEYGLVAQAIVVIQVTMMLASLGLPSVITRQALMTDDGLPRARSILMRGMAATGSIVVVALGVAALVLGNASVLTRSTVLVAIAAGAFFCVVECTQALMRAQDRPIAFVAISSSAMLGGPLAGLAFMLLGSRTAWQYVTGLLLGYLAAALVGLSLALGPTLGLSRRHDPGDMRAAYRLGLPMLPHMVALYLMSMSLVFIAGAVHGRADAGRLQLALLIGTAPNVLTTALNNSWAPAVFATPREHRGAVLQGTAANVASVTALIAAGVALLSPWLLRLVADERYAPDELVPAVALVCLGAMLSVAYLANVHLVFAEGRPAGLSVVTPAALTIGLLAAWLLGGRGLVWVAIGFPVAYAVLSTGVALLRRKVGAPGWNELVLAPALGLGAGLIVVGLLAPTSGPWALVRWALAVAAGVLVVQRVGRILRPATA